jgi:DNA-binding transcriptional MerR regulator
MYTIKEAASRSGVPVQLLRAWERRYGVVHPARTDSGYRLYDEPSIDRLRAMRRLIDDGWAPSTAATHLRDLDDDAVRRLAAVSVRASGPGTTRTVSGATELAEEFVGAASRFDERAVEVLLDEMFARGSFEQVVDELVLPSLVALGEGWAMGRVDVAAEHVAAGAVQRRLGAAFMAAGRAADGEGVVLVGLPPGARHDLGALAFATAVRRTGLGVRFLGADLPLQDWLDAAARTSAVAAAIGVILSSDVDPAERVGRALRAAKPGMAIAFGGRSADQVDRSVAAPAVVLPLGMTAAVEALRLEIDSRNGTAADR